MFCKQNSHKAVMYTRHALQGYCVHFLFGKANKGMHRGMKTWNPLL